MMFPWVPQSTDNFGHVWMTSRQTRRVSPNSSAVAGSGRPSRSTSASSTRVAKASGASGVGGCNGKCEELKVKEQIEHRRI